MTIILPTNELRVDGVDIATYGATLDTVPDDVLGSFTRSLATEARADGWGAVVTGAPSVGPRDITLVCTVQGASRATIAAAVEAFVAVWSRASVTVEVVCARGSRAFVGTATRVATTWLGRFSTGTWGARVTVTLTCPDPGARATTDTTVTVTTTAADAPVGTLPAPAVLTIRGPATHPSVEVRRPDGTLASSLVFGALVLGSGDTLVIDGDTLGMSKTIGGVTTSALGDRTSGRPIVLDPAWSQFGLPPTVRVLASVGASSTLVYRLRWM